ncbi:DUF3450 family protein [Pelagicoccus sp. SDUM812003]|uniref:DUF3450 family protein n=1 Tax=Pelagicoccus sp. SDUM812003 TaxID=3041267 RepID=UPI0028104BE2|nr:DUF3450 family protein [Pelagicoccus sp. SDUM812003]MDQ8204062.1 DUF3450 family protein [Pelagicoccus sp. SDUM812003]
MKSPSGKQHLKAALFAAIFPAAVYSLSADTVKQTQNALSEWISVEKQISEDKSEWIAQKEVLQNSIEFMKGEIGRLEEAIASAKENASAGEKKRAELDEKKEVLDAVTAEMKAAVLEYETRVKKMAEGWPVAFLDTVDTFLDRIPEEEKAEDAPLTIRLQNVVAILSQFDKFQSAITKDTAVQDVDGESREVTTLYYGFSYAYFIDGTGEYAGYGYPTGSGWDWVSDPSLSEDVAQLVAVYDRSTDASFVGLPTKIVTP